MWQYAGGREPSSVQALPGVVHPRTIRCWSDWCRLASCTCHRSQGTTSRQGACLPSELRGHLPETLETAHSALLVGLGSANLDLAAHFDRVQNHVETTAHRIYVYNSERRHFTQARTGIGKDKNHSAVLRLGGEVVQLLVGQDMGIPAELEYLNQDPGITAQQMARPRNGPSLRQNFEEP